MNRLKVGIGIVALGLLVWFGSLALATFQMNTKSILPVPGVVDFKSYQLADQTSSSVFASTIMDFGAARQYYVSCKMKIKVWSASASSPSVTWVFASGDDAAMTTNVRIGSLPVTYNQSTNVLGMFFFMAVIDTPQEYAIVSKTAQTVSDVRWDQECDAVPIR